MFTVLETNTFSAGDEHTWSEGQMHFVLQTIAFCAGYEHLSAGDKGIKKWAFKLQPHTQIATSDFQTELTLR